MLDQLFSWPRTADTGVGSVHGDGSSDLPISNCISGELGGVGMSIGYCTSSSPSVPTIITIVTPAKPISEDFLSDSLISVVPTRLEPEEEASSTQSSTRTFTAGGFLAAIFGIGIALSFWTPKNLWVFMGGFGFRRERRRQKNRQQRAVEAAVEVAVEGNKLTNGQKDKGKARAIHNEVEEGESSKSTPTEQTALLIGGPATYSSDLGLGNPHDSGIDLTNGEEARATRPEKLSIHPEPMREPELTESDMLKTIDEEEEIELPINENWTFADHQPSPIPSPRIRSPVPHIEPESPVTPPRVELEAVGHGTSYPFNRNLSVTPLPTTDVVDTPVTNGYGRKQPGANFGLDRLTVVETESPVLESTPKLSGVEKMVEVPVKVEEERIEMPLEVEVEEEVKAKVGEYKAGPSVSREVEVPTVEEVVIPAIVAVETRQVKDVEAPKEVETPKVEHVEAPKPTEALKPIEAPKVKEVETPQVELVEAPKVESVEPLKVEKVDTPKVEPKVEPVEAPKVEPKVESKVDPRVEPVESPKVKLVETPKIEIPEPKVETPKVEVPKAEAVVERPAEVKKVEVPKAEVAVERPVEVKKVEAEAVVERPAEEVKVEVVKAAEVVVERPAEVKKVEVAKSAPVAVIVPSTPQIELIPPTPAFNSSFSEEAEEFSKERAGEGEGAVDVDQPATTLPDVEEEEEPVVPTKAPARSMTSEQVRSDTGSLTVENNDKEDDDISIINHPISHSPDQTSLSGGDQEEEEPTIADETHRSGSRAPSIVGDDKSTKSGRRGFRRISSSLGRDRSVDSMKKGGTMRRSLTSGFTGKKSKKDGSAASSLQGKLGEPTPPPTPPEASQDAPRPGSQRSERRSMSWSNTTSKILSKEKRDNAKKNSDSEATGAADSTHVVDEVENTSPPQTSNGSISTNDRPTTADGGKSKIPRGSSWFNKKKSNGNLGGSSVAGGASTTSLATAKHEITHSTTEAVAPVDKGKGISRTPVEEAPKPTEPIKVIEAPSPPPPVEEEQKSSVQAVEPIAAVVPASDRPKAPRLKSGVLSVMAWGRKKK